MQLIKKIINKIFPSKQAKRTKPWFAIQGDKTLRLNYDLGENSVVFDLGGYEGQWASDIFGKYLCQIYVFEPHHIYAENIRQRFNKNKNIHVFQFGLGKEDARLLLYSADNASSSFVKKGAAHEIEIKKAPQFIQDNSINKIDLMKINIEGGEYDLLEALIDSGNIKIIKNIQIQFHDFVENADFKMKKIQDRLQQTHQLSYQFEFVWENWVLKN